MCISPNRSWGVTPLFEYSHFVRHRTVTQLIDTQPEVKDLWKAQRGEELGKTFSRFSGYLRC